MYRNMAVVRENISRKSVAPRALVFIQKLEKKIKRLAYHPYPGKRVITYYVERYVTFIEMRKKRACSAPRAARLPHENGLRIP